MRGSTERGIGVWGISRKCGRSVNGSAGSGGRSKRGLPGSGIGV